MQPFSLLFCRNSVVVLSYASHVLQLLIHIHVHAYTHTPVVHHSRFRGTRQLSQPKRSYKQQQHQHPQSTPSPISQSSHRQQSRQQQQLSQSGGNRSSGGDTLIVYHLDDFPTPFAKRLGGGDITLSDFKDKVFLRKGEYR